MAPPSPTKSTTTKDDADFEMIFGDNQEVGRRLLDSSPVKSLLTPRRRSTTMEVVMEGEGGKTEVIMSRSQSLAAMTVAQSDAPHPSATKPTLQVFSVANAREEEIVDYELGSSDDSLRLFPKGMLDVPISGEQACQLIENVLKLGSNRLLDSDPPTPAHEQSSGSSGEEQKPSIATTAAASATVASLSTAPQPMGLPSAIKVMESFPSLPAQKVSKVKKSDKMKKLLKEHEKAMMVHRPHSNFAPVMKGPNKEYLDSTQVFFERRFEGEEMVRDLMGVTAPTKQETQKESTLRATETSKREAVFKSADERGMEKVIPPKASHTATSQQTRQLETPKKSSNGHGKKATPPRMSQRPSAQSSSQQSNADEAPRKLSSNATEQESVFSPKPALKRPSTKSSQQVREAVKANEPPKKARTSDQKSKEVTPPRVSPKRAAKQVREHRTPSSGNSARSNIENQKVPKETPLAVAIPTTQPPKESSRGDSLRERLEEKRRRTLATAEPPHIDAKQEDKRKSANSCQENSTSESLIKRTRSDSLVTVSTVDPNAAPISYAKQNYERIHVMAIEKKREADSLREGKELPVYLKACSYYAQCYSQYERFASDSVDKWKGLIEFVHVVEKKCAAYSNDITIGLCKAIVAWTYEHIVSLYIAKGQLSSLSLLDDTKPDPKSVQMIALAYTQFAYCHEEMKQAWTRAVNLVPTLCKYGFSAYSPIEDLARTIDRYI